MFWIYDIPNSLFALLSVALSILIGAAGLMASRPHIARILGHSAAPNEANIEAHNGAVNTYLSVIGLFYGLTLGLISVSVWQSYSEVDERTNIEAATLGALYRSLASYPQPERARLEAELRDYTTYSIQKAWPQFKAGIVPHGASEHLAHFGGALYAFEPRTEGHKIMHTAAVGQFHELSELSRLRLLSVTSGLPPVLWLVILSGGALTIGTTYLFVLPSLRLHLLLTALASAMIGLLLFLMAAMDYPFRGEFSVGPDAFESTYSQFMDSNGGRAST